MILRRDAHSDVSEVLSRGDGLPKSDHKCRTLLGRVGGEVDGSGKARAFDFHPFRFQGRSIGGVFDRVDLRDDRVVNPSDVALLKALLARKN